MLGMRLFVFAHGMRTLTLSKSLQQRRLAVSAVAVLWRDKPVPLSRRTSSAPRA
jgi:hypothetical protein